MVARRLLGQPERAGFFVKGFPESELRVFKADLRAKTSAKPLLETFPDSARTGAGDARMPI